MKNLLETKAITRLRAAFRKNDLTLYVGAGASAASGIPTWNKLVLTVFLTSLRLGSQGETFSFPYISQAIAEWWFAKSGVPLDVAARTVRSSSHGPREFLSWVQWGLYHSFEFDSHGYPTPYVRSLIRQNPTLKAIVALCRHTKPNKEGLRTVVTYNLDGLLELALGSYPFQSFWKQTKVKSGTLPIYHVHGYVPVRDPLQDYSPRIGSLPEEVVLTEEQYHREAADPYSWANLAQLQAMTSSVGLAVGLSLSDPNMRRLLDVSRKAPSRPEMYALLQKPAPNELDDAGLEEISARTERILQFHDRSRREPLPRPNKTSSKWEKQLRQVWADLERVAIKRQLVTLRELGIEPIWCEHSEIPSFIERIVRRKL